MCDSDHPERATEDRALEAAAREIAENAHVLPWNVERMRSAVLAIMRRHGLRGPKKSPELRAAELRAEALAIDGLELAWGIIANVDGGDLTKQRDDWQDAVRRWADRFLPIVGRELQARDLSEKQK